MCGGKPSLEIRRPEAVSWILRGLEQALRMPPGGVILRIGAQHPAELHDKLAPAELLDLRAWRRGAAPALCDSEMPRCKRGNLRQMGDAHDLALRGKLTQPLAHHPGGVATNAGIH